MKKKYPVILFLLAVPFFLPAQTADKLERLLRTDIVSCEDAAQFVLEAAGPADRYGSADISRPAEAFRFALERNWLPGGAAPSGEAWLEGVALLLMRAFDIKGGLFYTLLKSPHYAFRELVYKDIIQGRTDPEMTVSGSRLVFLVNRILDLKEREADEAAARSVEEEGPVADNGVPGGIILNRRAEIAILEKQ